MTTEKCEKSSIFKCIIPIIQILKRSYRYNVSLQSLCLLNKHQVELFHA